MTTTWAILAKQLSCAAHFASAVVDLPFRSNRSLRENRLASGKMDLALMTQADCPQALTRWPLHPGAAAFTVAMLKGRAMDCILHIGTEKTGTTRMQSGLEAARASLRGAGVVMGEGLGGGNHRRVVQLVQAEPDHAMLRQGLAAVDEASERLQEVQDSLRADLVEARDNGAKAFLISSEHFHSRLKSVDEIAALHALLSPFVARFRVLVWFRPQHELRRSLYSTALKMGYRARPDAFQDSLDQSALYYNYHALLSLWAEVFGAEAVEARLYDPARDGFEALWAAIGGLGPCPDVVQTARENSAFGRAAAQIAYAYNLSTPGPDKDRSAGYRRAKVMRALGDVDAKDEALTLRGSDTFQAAFDASNTAFFQDFLPGGHFDPPRVAAPFDFDQLAPGQGRRIGAVIHALDTAGLERYSEELMAFDTQGADLYDLGEVFFAARKSGARPPRKRFFGLF